MNLRLEFAGGAELLFNNKRYHEVTFPPKETLTISMLLKWIVENLIVDKDRAFLLVEKETVRPGILVLINDTDWELLSQLSTELKDGDTITFISTLHGG
ncbi:unnamed protein product [Dracunculus medinensis]|uniref:Ubiquitin-related modifier 1 homolog n=1 Tax=Dracunculus medinensis TaxID=318479 RepID=A0A0N4UKN8_DRAME|nr:unnamed protein product [Dracunculus medinensis]